jgi:hypothetical protein
MPRKVRDYKDEYAKYQGKPEQIKRRSSRNKARRLMAKKGLVKKGDGKDVDHLNNNPLVDRPSNLKVVTKSANRSFPRNGLGGHKIGTH